MVLDGWSEFPQRDVAAAQASIKRALAIDRNHVIAHHVSGFLSRLQRRTNAAHDSFQTAIALNPNFAPGHAQLGITELELGRPEAVFPAVEKAIRLSPRDPSLGPWLAFVGMAHLHLGNNDDAVSWLERAINTGTPVALQGLFSQCAGARRAGRRGTKCPCRIQADETEGNDYRSSQCGEVRPHRVPRSTGALVRGAAHCWFAGIGMGIRSCIKACILARRFGIR